MLLRHERWVGLYETILRGKGYPQIDLQIDARAFLAIKSLFDSEKKAGRLLGAELIEKRSRILLDDIQINEADDWVALLFTIMDSQAADVAFRDVNTYQQREIVRAEGEAGALSAHWVLDLRAATNYAGYGTALEQVEGLSRSALLPFLAGLMKRASGQVITQDKHGDGIKADPQLIMDGLPSKTLEDSLQAGELVGLEVVQKVASGKMDRGGRAIEHSRSVKFKLPRRSAGEAALAILKGVAGNPEYDEFPTMKVRWKRPDGRTQTLSSDNDAASLLADAFTRIELMTGFDQNHLKTAYEKVRTDVAEAMVKILRNG